ncbi:hypothetical protein [Mucisphaera calidilacus]|uniref:Rod shape-determining protein MreD n=1 Tax=Mucisphaera calidilacus TaxID=2527982 RepID=A0A518BZC6_9BACT|nr:hypothetical protein [Mucisphaera calidilacus]QDU72319.1 hypothetical protein Pan265_21840 [Mucisphaera calidilacus]
MNWAVFGVLGYLLLALSYAGGPLLSVWGVRPEPLMILVVYVALMAQWRAAMSAALVGGLCLDLLTLYPGGIVLVGPHTLGMLMGAFVVHQLRNVVFRHSLLTVVILTGVGGLFAEIFTTALLVLRTLPWPVGETIPGWSPADALFGGFLSVLYTALLALPVGALLLAGERWFGFAERVQR